MTEEQIMIYECCKKDLGKISLYKKELPFGIQNHGCGSQDHPITFKLEEIHREMYADVIEAINTAEKKIKGIIEKL